MWFVNDELSGNLWKPLISNKTFRNKINQSIFIQPRFCYHEPCLNARTGEAFTTLLAGASEIKFRPLFTEGQFCSSAKK